MKLEFIERSVLHQTAPGLLGCCELSSPSESRWTCNCTKRSPGRLSNPYMRAEACLHSASVTTGAFFLCHVSPPAGHLATLMMALRMALDKLTTGSIPYSTLQRNLGGKRVHEPECEKQRIPLNSRSQSCVTILKSS